MDFIYYLRKTNIHKINNIFKLLSDPNFEGNYLVY